MPPGSDTANVLPSGASKDTPLERLTTAEDIAHAVLFLASDRMARQVTGQLFSVSGGYTMP